LLGPFDCCIFCNHNSFIGLDIALFHQHACISWTKSRYLHATTISKSHQWRSKILQLREYTLVRGSRHAHLRMTIATSSTC
jgi:hypothetical protein